jgi:hypothetical protein
MGETRKALRILVEISFGKWPFGRARRRYEVNIRMDLKERGCEDQMNGTYPAISLHFGLTTCGILLA